MPWWCKGNTSAFQADDAGSIPVHGSAGANKKRKETDYLALLDDFCKGVPT